MRPPSRLLAAAGSAALLLPAALSGQEALVLSTGGSRGFVHAGALVALEERGRDPDLVVGNSMGAIIGALYAAGYAPDEIWRFVEETDWDDLFMPEPLVLGPDRAVHFPQVRVGLGLRPLEMTRGFIPDWRVGRTLVRLLFDAQARTRGDFDRLARRFRAVTTDMSDGREVVLARGDLARAVRASMATPGFFSPVLMGDTLLADGGIANYLPLSVARRLGARSIVAVDVSRPPSEITTRDPLAMGGRAVALLMVNAAPDTTPPDVLVRPTLDPAFSGARFPEDPRPLLELGLTSTLEALPATDARPRPRERSLPPPPGSLGALVVEVDEPALEAMARRAFAGVVPGAYDADEILRRVDRLYASGLVSGVWPRVEVTASGDEILAVRLDPTPRQSLSGAAGYENDRGGRVWGAIQRRAALGAAPLELTLAGATTGPALWGEASARLHPHGGGLAWAGGVHYQEMDDRTFDGDGRVRDEREVQRMGGWVGAQLRRAFPDWVLTAGLRAESVDVEDGESGASWGPALRLASATPPSARVGTPSSAGVDLRAGAVDYARARLRTAAPLPAGPVEAAAVLDAAWTWDGAPPDARPALGDDGAMPGLRWGEERGVGRLVAGLDLAYPLFLQGWARLRLRAGTAPDRPGDLDAPGAWVVGGALEGVWSTPLGPVVVGFGLNGRGRHRVDVSLGPGF